MRLTLLCILCYYLAPIYGQTDLESIRRNAYFQLNLAKVALQNQILGAEKVELNLAKGVDQVLCIAEKKDKILVEGDGIVSETVGRIIPKVDRLYEHGSHTEIQEFLERTDYPAYKRAVMEEFKKKLIDWVPEMQERMADCRRQA